MNERKHQGRISLQAERHPASQDTGAAKDSAVLGNASGSRKGVRLSLGVIAALGVAAGSVQLAGRERADTSPIALASRGSGDASAAATNGAPEEALPVATVAGSAEHREPLPALDPTVLRDRPTGSGGNSNGPGFEVGDRLKLAFYERVEDVEQNKWGRPAASMRGFEQRQEFSGEYAIQEDGSLTVPLLGPFPIGGRSAQEVQKDLASAFETLTGRRAVVTVALLERPPVYVLGPVKAPGAYKYVPGMTVLHAIALAGGFERQNLEPWQRVEAVRETQRQRGAMETMPVLMARVAVLEAERDGIAANAPRRLTELVGQSEARGLVAQEAGRRLAIAAARRSQKEAVSGSIEAAKQELRMWSDRMRPIDDLIKLREERVNAMRNLMTTGVVGRMVVIQAQSELADAEQRRQDAANQHSLAQQRVGQLEQEQARLSAETRGSLETEILTVEQQIESNQRELTASEGILGTLLPARAPYAPNSVPGLRYASTAGQSQFAYEIVHMRPSGPVAHLSDGMSRLQPGDLVRIIVSDAAPDPGPAETRADRQTGRAIEASSRQ